MKNLGKEDIQEEPKAPADETEGLWVDLEGEGPGFDEATPGAPDSAVSAAVTASRASPMRANRRRLRRKTLPKHCLRTSRPVRPSLSSCNTPRRQKRKKR